MVNKGQLLSVGAMKVLCNDNKMTPVGWVSFSVTQHIYMKVLCNDNQMTLVDWISFSVTQHINRLILQFVGLRCANPTYREYFHNLVGWAEGRSPTFFAFKPPFVGLPASAQPTKMTIWRWY